VPNNVVGASSGWATAQLQDIEKARRKVPVSTDRRAARRRRIGVPLSDNGARFFTFRPFAPPFLRFPCPSPKQLQGKSFSLLLLAGLVLDQPPTELRAVAVASPRNIGAKGRGFAVAAFFIPWVVGIAAFAGLSDRGLAQQAGDPLSMLQQLQRGGLNGSLGGLNGGSVVDTTTGTPQSQVLQPQVMMNLQRLPPSRLEDILSARAGMQLRQFGYDQLGMGREVVVPETGAVADDYILGPGDEIVVSLRGQENSDVRTNVDRNGRVILPRLAPIAAAGRSFGTFRQDVDAAVRRAYVASTASVAVGRVRQISVLVSGEVRMPGPRIVTGLSSVVDALLLSSGVKKTGSLRNVHLVRHGQTYTVDLYSILTGGGAGGGMRLADGDRIVVPLLGPTVAIAGLVRRPAIYELATGAKGITVASLLALAGGEEVRGRYRLSVQRILPDGQISLVPLQNTKDQVRESEILRVELGANFAGTQATLSGGTGLAGQYAITHGTRLSEVIRAPGALGVNPYTLFGIIVRKNPRTLLRSLVAFTPAAVLAGAEDEQLQPDDIVRPLSVDESRLLTFVVKTYLDKLALDQARIRNPLATSRQDAVATAQASAANSSSNNSSNAATSPAAIAAAQAAVATAISPSNPFGLQPGELASSATDQEDFSGVPADQQRNDIIALLDVAAPGTRTALMRQQAYQQSLLTANGNNSNQTPIQAVQAQQAALVASQTGIPLQPTASPAGQPYPAVPQSQSQQSLNGGATGPQADQMGQQTARPSADLPPAANFQDQNIAPGEVATNREARTFGELAQQLAMDPLVLVNFLIDHRARLDGAVRGPGTYLVGPSASLADLVQAAGGTASWADESGVELVTTVVDRSTGRAASQSQTLPLRQGMLASYVIRPRDQFRFNKVFTDTGIGSVTVQGDIRFPGTYSIRRGEHLSELLIRSGGLTSTAYPQGTVFLRKSAAQVEQDGYNRAADEIQSQLLAGMARVGNDKIPGDAINAIQGFVTQLRNQKALGRIAIAADPSVLAANPSQDPLLEPGDVLFIPQRPSTVAVLGEVMQPGSYSYQPGMKVGDYIKKAGGYAQFANDDMTFIVMPDGSARRLDTSWLSFDATALPPGSTIVVPRDLAPLFTRQIVLDVTSIMSSFAVTIASLAVLAKQ
jgi:protein involved in polysaccharide export with SLBB domain